MLCGIHPPSSHHHHRFLRSFRSHRSLRHDDSSENEDDLVGSLDRMHHHHRQRPSDASSLARPSVDSSSRASMASSRGARSIGWDSLRMNPSTLAPGTVSPLLQDFVDESRPYQPHELRHARSSHSIGSTQQQQQQQQQPPRQPPSTFSTISATNTVIHEGFDFGFANNHTSHTPTPPAAGLSTPTSRLHHYFSSTHDHGHGDHQAPPRSRERTHSLTPSEASSVCSLSFSDDSSGSLDECAGLAPAPAPRPRARPPRCGLDGRPVEDDAEVFLRRGGWKRRGIVFGDGEGLVAGEEETWEI